MGFSIGNISRGGSNTFLSAPSLFLFVEPGSPVAIDSVFCDESKFICGRCYVLYISYMHANVHLRYRMFLVL